jgi:hypothetical protein
MRFIIDLYRYLIFAFCAVIIISGTLLIVAVLDQSNSVNSYMTTTVVLTAVIAFAVLILNLGGIATLISFHDRHADLVEELEQTNATLARIATAMERHTAVEAAQ